MRKGKRTPIADGIAVAAKKRSRPEITHVVAGSYRIPVEIQRFRVWEEEIRQKVGFQPRDVKQEILRRLGL